MIHGKSVTLRTMESQDLAEVKAVNDDAAVRANVVGWSWPVSLTEQARWHASAQGGDTHRWVVIDPENRLIGVTGLWNVDLHSRNAYTALKLGGRNEVRGRGLGTDAIKTVMAFAFYDVGLERLYGSLMEHNEASRRAYCDKCGWSVEGLSRSHVWRHGQFVDVLQVGVLRSDFEALPDAEDYRQLVMCGRTG